MADEPETIQTHISAIEKAILDAEIFAGTIEDGLTRDAAIEGLSFVHEAALRAYKRFKNGPDVSEEAQALRSGGDDKD